jgi:hypothetical protein
MDDGRWMVEGGGWRVEGGRLMLDKYCCDEFVMSGKNGHITI